MNLSRPPCLAALLAHGFQPLPLREIGLESDEARRLADRLDAALP